MECFIRNGRL